MDGSASTVLSLGFGSWGTVNLAVTLGFGIGTGVSVTPRILNLTGTDNTDADLTGVRCTSHSDCG